MYLNFGQGYRIIKKELILGLHFNNYDKRNIYFLCHNCVIFPLCEFLLNFYSFENQF